MKTVLLIGLGHFGKHIARELNRLGHQVMAVDRNETRVNDILPLVTNAQIGDSTNMIFASFPLVMIFKILWKRPLY